MRLEEEKKLLSKDYSALVEEKAKLTRDLATAQADIEAARIKLRSAEEAKERLSQDLSVANRERALAVSQCKEAERRRDSLEEQVIVFLCRFEELWGGGG